jgi:hypothetical protein
MDPATSRHTENPQELILQTHILEYKTGDIPSSG